MSTITGQADSCTIFSISLQGVIRARAKPDQGDVGPLPRGHRSDVVDVYLDAPWLRARGRRRWVRRGPTDLCARWRSAPGDALSRVEAHDLDGLLEVVPGLSGSVTRRSASSSPAESLRLQRSVGLLGARVDDRSQPGAEHAESHADRGKRRSRRGAARAAGGDRSDHSRFSFCSGAGGKGSRPTAESQGRRLRRMTRAEPRPPSGRSSAQRGRRRVVVPERSGPRPGRQPPGLARRHPLPRL